jgi:hypothetical protein
MRPGFVVACAVAFPLLTFAGQGLHAQDVWPPDDDGPPPPQQAYPQPGSTQPGYGQQNPQQAYGAPGNAQQPNGYAQPGYGYDQGVQGLAPGPGLAAGGGMQPMNPQQLDQLVAPIALYPDQLLAQILTASTYPAQISAADQWLRNMGNAAPEQVAAGASEQTAWDPSVKALTAFPQVLQMLDGNLQWTTALGNAYYNQPQDVLQTVQVMRQRAEQAGNLQGTPQEQVVDDPGYISVAPTNPETVYVPTYNPWAVYGQPVSPYPGFYEGAELGAAIGSGVEFGVGFAVGAFLRMPFGLLSWGFDWLDGGILFNHGGYWPRGGREMHDWGFAHGGPRYGGWYQRGGWRGGGGTQMARFGDYHNQEISVHGGFPVARPGGGAGGQNGFNRTGGYPTARPGGALGGQNGFGQDGMNRNGYTGGPQQGFNRLGGQVGGNGAGGYGGGYSRAYPGQQAHSQMPGAVGRPQPYGGGVAQGYTHAPEAFRGQTGGQPSYGGPRGGYGGGYSGGTTQAGQGFVGRQGGGYGIPRYSVPTQGYRAPTQSYGQGGFSRGPSQAYAGGYAGVGHGGSGSLSSGYSGSYGGGHAQSFGRGHSSASHSFGGGHAQSFSGGHSSGFSGGGHSSSHGFGGGSHGGGGGHSSGGGHSHGKH